MRRYTLLDHLLLICAAICAIYLLSGCGHKKPAQPHVINVPARCTIVDSLYDCDANNICKAHVKVKPDPDCNEFRPAIVLPVSK